MVNNLAKIEIVDVNLGDSVKLSSKENIQSARCLNNKPTSAEVRCGLTSNLVNLKSVTNVHIDFLGIDFSGITSEVKLKINHEYLFNQNTFLNLNAQGIWYLNENTIDGVSLDSEILPNHNVLDAVIPPASCFNMIKKETIEKYKIPLTAVAKILVYNGSGDRVVDSQLSSIAHTMNSSAEIFGNKIIKIPIDGHIEVNLIGAEQNDVTPCGS